MDNLAIRADDKRRSFVICDTAYNKDTRTEENNANARRIVACVNACKGIRTDDLEHGGVGCLYSSVTAISKM